MCINVKRFRFIVWIIAVSFSQMAHSLDVLPKEVVDEVADELGSAASDVGSAASAVEWAAKGITSAARDFRYVLPIVVGIFIAQALVGVLNLVVLWRIMRSIVELNLRLSSTTPDDQSSSGP